MSKVKKVKDGCNAVENGVIAGYKAVEDGVVAGYKKNERGFVIPK